MKTKKTILSIIILGISLTLNAQVTIIIDSLPDYTPENEQVYVSVQWTLHKCGDPDFAMHKNQEDKWEITIEKPENRTGMWYSFNRGNWRTSETDSLNRITYTLQMFSSAETVHRKIYNWYDNESKPSTAASNVILLSDSFPVPQFDQFRSIYLYLPPDYDVSTKSYPVIYMNDGEELFDLHRSFNTFEGDWKVDETLNELASEGIDVPIVVAIDNGDNRLSELSPWDFNYPYYGIQASGAGENYLDFLINTLKPFIDSSFRTFPEPENTAIMGASLGGLISYYGALMRPDVFRRAGIFSPSYWVSDSVWTMFRDIEVIHPMRLYQMVGTEEQEPGDDYKMVDNVIKMNGMLNEYGYSEDEITFKIVEGGEHRSSTWGPEFREAYLWLFPEAITTSVKTITHTELKIFPNPAENNLYLEAPLTPNSNMKFQIINVNGTTIVSGEYIGDNKINISQLPSGLYFLIVKCTQVNYSAKFVKK